VAEELGKTRANQPGQEYDNRPNEFLG